MRTVSTPPEFDLLKAPEVASLLRLSKVGFWRLRRDDVSFPTPVNVARPLWHRHEIAEWLESRRLASARPGSGLLLRESGLKGYQDREVRGVTGSRARKPRRVSEAA